MKVFGPKPDIWFLRVIPLFYGICMLTGNAAIHSKLQNSKLIPPVLYYSLPCIVFVLSGLFHSISGSSPYSAKVYKASVIHFWATVSFLFLLWLCWAYMEKTFPPQKRFLPEAAWYWNLDQFIMQFFILIFILYQFLFLAFLLLRMRYRFN